MGDQLVRFVADVNSHCVGDVLVLSKEERDVADAEAEKLGIDKAYETVAEQSEAQTDAKAKSKTK